MSQQTLTLVNSKENFNQQLTENNLPNEAGNNELIASLET